MQNPNSAVGPLAQGGFVKQEADWHMQMFTCNRNKVMYKDWDGFKVLRLILLINNHLDPTKQMEPYELYIILTSFKSDLDSSLLPS